MAENNNETQKVTKTFPDGGRAVLTIDRNGVILDYQLERGTQTSTSAASVQYEGRILDLERRVQKLGGYSVARELRITKTEKLFIGSVCLPFAAEVPKGMTLAQPVLDPNDKSFNFKATQEQFVRPYTPYWLLIEQKDYALFEEGGKYFAHFVSTEWRDPLETPHYTSPIILDKEGKLNPDGTIKDIGKVIYLAFAGGNKVQSLSRTFVVASPQASYFSLLRYPREEYKLIFGTTPNGYE